MFFSFFCWYSYSLSSAIPYNRPNLHSYHHERIPPFQFTVTNVHHFECCAYFTLFICNIYGWRSCTWKCIKWCIEPPTPLPPIDLVSVYFSQRNHIRPQGLCKHCSEKSCFEAELHRPSNQYERGGCQALEDKRHHSQHSGDRSKLKIQSKRILMDKSISDR